MYVAKTKALISFAVTAKLICVFVFAYAKRWFSHDAAQMFFQRNKSSNFFTILLPSKSNFLMASKKDKKCKSYSCLVMWWWFNFQPTAEVIQRQAWISKSHLKDWRSPSLNSPPVIYKATIFTMQNVLIIAA